MAHHAPMLCEKSPSSPSSLTAEALSMWLCAGGALVDLVFGLREPKPREPGRELPHRQLPWPIVACGGRGGSRFIHDKVRSSSRFRLMMGVFSLGLRQRTHQCRRGRRAGGW